MVGKESAVTVRLNSEVYKLILASVVKDGDVPIAIYSNPVQLAVQLSGRPHSTE
jgi:hypothetical protein